MAVVYWKRDRTLPVGEGKGYAHERSLSNSKSFIFGKYEFSL